MMGNIAEIESQIEDHLKQMKINEMSDDFYYTGGGKQRDQKTLLGLREDLRIAKEKENET
tara:strand:+ start:681 stop:860 length:180 start_codon:yes stop_codon:yes gene_type:complete